LCERFGVSDVYSSWDRSLTDYDYHKLGRLGWYTDQEADYVNCPGPVSCVPGWTTRRVSLVAKDKIASTDNPVLQLYQAHPSWFGNGSVWQVGNHLGSDCYNAFSNSPKTASTDTEQYIKAYNICYQQAKTINPTFKVMSGTIFLDNKLDGNLPFLTTVLKQYYQLYNKPMPIDIFNIQIIVPPGTADPSEYVKTKIATFRKWMSSVDVGSSTQLSYRNSELWITALGFNDPRMDESRAIENMQQTIQWLMSNNSSGNFDGSLGMPQDDNRLVQAWGWYALNYGNYSPLRSNLFDLNGNITPLGQAYADLIPTHCPEPISLLHMLLFFALIKPRYKNNRFNA
jgi:hypothetical protein